MKTIYCPPKWKAVLKMFRDGWLDDISILEPACEIADSVLQAELDGKKEITFIINDDHSVQVKE